MISTFVASGQGTSCRNDSQFPRGRVFVRQWQFAPHWSAQPHHATTGQQLQVRRFETRRHSRRQGVHQEGMEKSPELPENSHTRRRG